MDMLSSAKNRSVVFYFEGFYLVYILGLSVAHRNKQKAASADSLVGLFISCK